MISKFYTKEFSNSRMVWYNETAQRDDTITFKGHLQQITADRAEHLGLNFSKSYVIWCPLDTDVKEGDLLSNNGDNYKVKAIKDLDVGLNRHKEVYVEKEENYE